MKKDIFMPADILLPEGISLENWSVIACDQFSSERDYWERVRDKVAGAPTTLNMILPEAYLEGIDEANEIEKIAAAMDECLSSGVLREIKDSFIFIERTLPDGHVRRGLLGTIDLEDYEFSCTEAAIRASEGTVLDRLPTRIRIRTAASLELPHIIAFIDDRDKTVIEPLSEKADSLPLLYDFTLMEGGGSIRGMQVTGGDAEAVSSAMRALHEEKDILMVMGDGNHSLAAAKEYWNALKSGLSESERLVHPARRAMIEVNNLYDPAIGFEAIHRVVFGVKPIDFISEFEATMAPGTDYKLCWVSQGRRDAIGISADCIGNMIAAIQAFLDEYAKRSGCRIDYIHGEDVVHRLIEEEDTLGIILPAMDKSELFATVAAKRLFPKKSFSVGRAREKRYYLECREIRM